MLDYLEVYHRIARNRNGRRKLRLFASACCRRLWANSEVGIQLVELAERYADGLAEWQQLRAAAERNVVGWDLWQAAERLASYRPQDATDNYALHLYQARHGEDSPIGCLLVREVFGNPFRPSVLPPAVLRWNSGTVRRIAEGIYEERAFDRLPILHDALLDAGCDDEASLSHCREPGPHVRGCWVIDLLLGKE
jgi:hypothetical protein